MEISDNLLDCPFCGRKPTIERWHGGAPTKHMVSCSAQFEDECKVVPMVTGETKEEAIKNWNTRKSDKQILEDIYEEVIYADNKSEVQAILKSKLKEY